MIVKGLFDSIMPVCSASPLNSSANLFPPPTIETNESSSVSETQPNQPNLAAQVLIPAWVIQDQNDILGSNFTLCSQDRLGNIFKGLGAFESSDLLLNEIANECDNNGLKLAFVTGKEYSFKLRHSCSEFLFLAVPDEVETEYSFFVAPSNEISQGVNFSRVKILDEGNTSNQIEAGVVEIKLADGKTAEGYSVGHELYHVLDFLKLREDFVLSKFVQNKKNVTKQEKYSPNSQDWKASQEREMALQYIRESYNTNELFNYANASTDKWDSFFNELFKGELPEELNALRWPDVLSALETLFTKVPEARNILGLDFPGDYQFLQEIDSSYIRMPYAEYSVEDMEEINKMQELKLLASNIIKAAATYREKQEQPQVSPGDVAEVFGTPRSPLNTPNEPSAIPDVVRIADDATTELNETFKRELTELTDLANG